ncbi:MAG: hypothetical protein RI894_442 [Bacteroidota bacterium]|jgi:hypothetical protein
MIEVQKERTSKRNFVVAAFFTFFFGVFSIVTIFSYVDIIEEGFMPIIGSCFMWSMFVTFALRAVILGVFLYEKNTAALILTAEGLNNRTNFFTKDRIIPWHEIKRISLYRDKDSLFFWDIVPKDPCYSFISPYLKWLKRLDSKLTSINCALLATDKDTLKPILVQYVDVQEARDIQNMRKKLRGAERIAESMPPEIVEIKHLKMRWYMAFATSLLLFFAIFCVAIILVLHAFSWASFLGILTGTSFSGLLLYYCGLPIFGKNRNIPALILSKDGIQVNNFVNKIAILPWSDIRCVRFSMQSISTKILTIIPEDTDKYKDYNATINEKTFSGSQINGHFNLSMSSLNINERELIDTLHRYNVIIDGL